METKLEYLKALERKAHLQENLPHLWGWKWYKWAREFFESRNRLNFLCAANQISKSSTQIRKCIDWATDMRKWPSLWPTTPKQFWYLYPDSKVATVEFEEKWEKEFLPRGPYKDHEIYGWKAEMNNRRIHAIRFNSGVTVYFKTYEQDPQSLQSSSVYAIFCDEELPYDLYPELAVRMSSPSVRGYFHMVFTATLGQEFWRQTIENVGTKHERFKGAFKRQVSMYDCLVYEDGTPSSWTYDTIDEVKRNCANESEVQRRVYGKFVVDKNLTYDGFSRERNVTKGHPLPSDWLICAGVDIGSGGSAHPAAICFVAVSPDFKKGRVFKGWRGDGIKTSSSDIMIQFKMMKGAMKPIIQCFDWASSEFGLVAQRTDEPFQPADKDRDLGVRMLNTLFRGGMLKIHDYPELEPLVFELLNATDKVKKTNAKDDMIDALRYAISKVPWDYSALLPETHTVEKNDANLSIRERKYREAEKEANDNLDLFEAEFDEANELMEYYQDDGDEMYE